MRRWLALLGILFACIMCCGLTLYREKLAWIHEELKASLWSKQRHGFQFRTYVTPDGIVHNYSVFVPVESRRMRSLPVLLFLNGFGKNGSDGTSHLIDGIAPVAWDFYESCPFLIVFPQCHIGERWEEKATAARAIAMLDESIEEFGGDEDRVYLTGVSSGGDGVWVLAHEYPNRFAAIAPMSSWCPTGVADGSEVVESPYGWPMCERTTRIS